MIDEKSYEDGSYLLLKENDNSINDFEKNQIIDVMEKNIDELYEDEYYYNNLFSIIHNDYQNYPNINHIETISNIEIFVILALHDYNEINLNYEFKEENIKNNSIELFGGNFVFNNINNCF